MMEIGSEMQLDLTAYDEPVSDTVFSFLSDFNTLFVDSGRSAIRLLNQTLPSGKVLLPNYICKSVIDSFGGREIVFYPINRDFTFDADLIIEKMEESNPQLLMVMNYWGGRINARSSEKISEYCKVKNKLIIEDTSHSVFTQPNAIGDYCVCSLRKWFPVARGGVVYSKNELPEYSSIRTGAPETKIIALLLKQLFIEDENRDYNKIYRELFLKDSSNLKLQKDIFTLPPFSKFILERTSVNTMIEKRKSNYEDLLTMIDKVSFVKPIEFYSSDCVPFVMPIYTQIRDELREYFIDNKIYCAVHWPLEDKRQIDINSSYIGKHILSINIDQRYDTNDMERICAVLNSFNRQLL